MVYFGMDSYKKLSGMAEKKESADKVAASPAAAGGGSSQDLSGAVSQQKQQLDESFKNVTADILLRRRCSNPLFPRWSNQSRFMMAFVKWPRSSTQRPVYRTAKAATVTVSKATKIREIGRDLCMEYVRDGLPFNPYKQKAATATGECTAGHAAGKRLW